MSLLRRLRAASLPSLCALVLLGMLAAALHDTSRAWDGPYYHLPFAARLVGLLPASEFVFHRMNEARYEGFPLLGELLQGLAWRLLGRPEAANLVALGSLPLFALFARRRLGIPAHLTLLGLLAVPLIHLHATACYVDLPANLAASAVILVAVQAYASSERLTDGSLALACVAAGIAANMRFQLHVVLGAALLLLGLRALRQRLADAHGPARRRSLSRLAALALVLLPLAFFSPLKNVLVHGNPYYPVELRLFGRTLPGADTPYEASPPWLARAPRPARFAASLLELGVRPFPDARRWTVDQWMPDDSTGSRMGGFFGAYVVAQLLMLGARCALDRARAVRVTAAGVALLAALTSVMPQSHELRYYLYFMVVLVTANLALACRPEALDLRALRPGAQGALAALALGVVLGVTRLGYVRPTGSTFAELVAEHVSAADLAGIRDGERVCVERAPWDMLWAARFHGPRRYVVKQAEEPAECEGYRRLAEGR